MKHRQDERAELCMEFYNVLITALKYSSRRCGYALAVHGSLRRDIDLIACPWRDTATSAEGLIEDLRGVTEAIIGTARIKDSDPNPARKPCGRLAWSIYLTPDDSGPYLDISVMPALIDAGKGEEDVGQAR